MGRRVGWNRDGTGIDKSRYGARSDACYKITLNPIRVKELPGGHEHRGPMNRPTRDLTSVTEEKRTNQDVRYGRVIPDEEGFGIQHLRTLDPDSHSRSDHSDGRPRQQVYVSKKAKNYPRPDLS